MQGAHNPDTQQDPALDAVTELLITKGIVRDTDIPVTHRAEQQRA